MASSSEDDYLPTLCNDNGSNQSGRKRKSPETRGHSARQRGGRCGNSRTQLQSSTKTAERGVTATSRGRRGVTRGRRPRKTAPVTSRSIVNLDTSVDVLILHSDEESSLLEPLSPVTDAECSKENRTDYANTNHARNKQKDSVSGKCVKLSDDENDAEQKHCTPLAGFDPNITFSDSDSDDLYSVNHNAIKASAQEVALRGLHEAQQEQKYTAALLKSTASPSPHREIEVSDSDDDCRSLSPVPSTPPSPEVSSIQLSARKMVKMSKRTLALLAKADKIGKTMDLDLEQSLNKSSSDIDFLFVADSNPIITMTVKHGLSSFSKISIRKLDKFGSVYQKMAELHDVRFDNVVLSLHDSILSSDQTPADVGLTVADIVECGIIRRSRSSGEGQGQVAPDDENTITLKFQCSQMRGSLLLSINKFEKMAGIMQSYAEKKGQPIAKYRFMFDGERLDPNETPNNLDLEGGECIDVFPA